MIDQLDLLLEQARIEDPFDDGFVQRVMISVQAEAARKKSPRRFFTRPAVLAAAAVLVTGGALAAVRTATAPHHEAKLPEVITHQTGVHVVSSNPIAGRRSTTSVRPPTTFKTHKAASFVPQRFSKGDYEWGYTSEHDSYVLDKSTGLRLDSDTHKNVFTKGEAQAVTLTLTNTSDAPLGVYAPQGCVLSVAAFESTSAQGSKAYNASAPSDPATAKAWECATDGNSTQASASERIVLAPNTSVIRSAKIALKAEGLWAVSGVCHCKVFNPEDDPGDGNVLTQLPELVLGHPLTGDTRSTTPESYGMLTPPIAVRSK